MLFLETHKSYTHTVNRHALDDDIHVYIENQTMDPTSDISLLASTMLLRPSRTSVLSLIIAAHYDAIHLIRIIIQNPSKITHCYPYFEGKMYSVSNHVLRSLTQQFI